MEKIIDYLIISEDSRENLRDTVKVHIAEGWQPHGNLIVIERPSARNPVELIQTMVKYQGIEAR